MTFEDFFTLSEMKNGLATLARVEELISVMQEKKSSAMSNASDTVRQWLSVATILAATEHEDCLNHFVKLKGLCYLNQWLQEAVKSSDGNADLTIEELLNALLGSLERLPINREDFVSSGIQTTVEQLVESKSLNIKEKAKALSERWKHAMENGASSQDMDNDDLCVDDNLKAPNNVGTVHGDQVMAATSSNSAVANSNVEDTTDALHSTLVLISCHKNLSGTDDSSLCPAVEMTSCVTDDHCDASILKDEIAKYTKIEVNTKGDNPSKSVQTDDLVTSIDRKEVVGEKKSAEKKSAVEMGQSSELGLEYGEIDALEVARQVAIEVEREVFDYREPFCSSSPDGSSGEDMGPRSSEPVRNEVQNGKISTPDKDLNGASSPIDERGSGVKTDKNRCFFDLNEVVCVEETDDHVTESIPNNSVTVSAPIAVAATKGTPFLQVHPNPRFEGENGWKGSAATSAFRLAVRKTPDTITTSSGHKRKANVFEIDLNVADTADDADGPNPLPLNPIPVSSGMHSLEDPAEVNSKRADRLKLDLNRLSDEDITMSSASSSSSRQPATRDFDLNDNLNFPNPNNLSSNNSGITIMGSKITERKGDRDGAPQYFMGTNGPMMPYGHIPTHAYGYNGYMNMMGPSMPYHYMMDSRGVTVLPQILGTTGLNTASSSIPPFVMSMPNSSPGLNGAGTSQSGLDLNSSFMSVENGRREGGNFKQFFMPSQSWQ